MSRKAVSKYFLYDDSGPSATQEALSSVEAASPTRAAAAARARREEQPQPSTSNQAHMERPFVPAKAESISRDTQKALADTVVAFCKSYPLFSQEQMRCAIILQCVGTDHGTLSCNHILRSSGVQAVCQVW